MGLIIANGKQVEVDLDTVTFIDDPKCHLGPRSFRKRGADEQRGLCGIIVHTTAGIPGGKDLRPQVLLEGVGGSNNAGPKYAAMWQSDLSKFGGSHFVIDFDGMVYQLADIVTEAAYHASLANGRSVGIEVCQDRKTAGIRECQVESNTKLVNSLTAILGIQRQICQLPYKGKPVECLEGKLTRYGVFGHRNLTSTRGSGDPGDYLLEALQEAGYEAFDYSEGEDLETWKNRQGELGIDSDGIPGPGTVQALKEAGYQDGLWVQV